MEVKHLFVDEIAIDSASLSGMAKCTLYDFPTPIGTWLKLRLSALAYGVKRRPLASAPNAAQPHSGRTTKGKRRSHSRDTMVSKELQPVQALRNANGRVIQEHAQRNGNCGQWHGRAETSITSNHLGGVILGITPTTQERVACNATSCKQINKTKGTCPAMLTASNAVRRERRRQARALSAVRRLSEHVSLAKAQDGVRIRAHLEKLGAG